jgi:Sulfotransferase family
VEKINVKRNGLEQARFWSRKLYRRAIQEIGSRFYVNPTPDLRKCILVTGAARSGTTWLADLIASQIPSRILFEPFNPELVPDYSHFHYFQYMRPGTEHPEFHAFAQKVFTGEIRNRWIDHQNERIVSRFRLVKEIRANLALKWLHDNFPEVPLLLIIRHPCAVVLSRMELGWATDHDIEPFVSQPKLLEDHLGPYLDLICSAETPEEKHAVIWSVSNMVPLKQFSANEVKVVYYENLCTQPEIELPGIFEGIGYQYSNRLAARRDRPSQTARSTSAVATGTNKIDHWKTKLSRTQIDNILRVVKAFGLGHLYDDSVLPLHNE